MPVIAAAAIGGAFSFLGSRKASKQAAAAQAEASAVAREQLGFAREQQNFVNNTIRPELLAQGEQLGAYSRQVGGHLEAVGGRGFADADYFRGRIQNTWQPLEDQIVREAISAGGAAQQQQWADRALADTRQAISTNNASQMRMARAYGGDVNRLMAAQADNSANQALVEVAAINKARQAAEELGFNKRMSASSLGGRSFAGLDSGMRQALGGFDGAMRAYALPAQHGLESARVLTGAAGGVGQLYGSAGNIAAGMYDTATRQAGAEAAGMGSFAGQVLTGKSGEAIGTRVNQLWSQYGPGGYHWNPAPMPADTGPVAGVPYADAYGSRGGW